MKLSNKKFLPKISQIIGIFLLIASIFCVKTYSIGSYQNFKNGYPSLIKVNANEARSRYTDQQLAKIGVIKEYSAITQGRLYLISDKQREALESYEFVLLQAQSEGFDQTEILNQTKLLKNKIKDITVRIDKLSEIYSGLELVGYEEVRPRYNQILEQSVEIASDLEITNTEITQLIMEEI